MLEVLKGVNLNPVFREDEVSCYQLQGGNFLNKYYITSEAHSRKLLNQPEVVGFEVYQSLLPSTARMMRYFYEQGQVSSANILSILRGALNYPLEESCFEEGVPVHDISFLSCERVFNERKIVTGLDVKYCKLSVIDQSTLMIGDIIASGDTLVYCLKYIVEAYQKQGKSLRNIILFTIGGTLGITISERLTKEIRKIWPEFEGFSIVYYEGIYTCYTDGGLIGFQVPMVDFAWRDGIVAPEYRKETLSRRDTLFEKCIIYDGGARRYQISEHIQEVLEYWYELKAHADEIAAKALMEERLGYQAEITREDWAICNHYETLEEALKDELYAQEQAYIQSLEGVTLKEITETRIGEIETALKQYML